MSSKSASEPPPAARRPARSWSLASRLTLWYTASTFTLVLAAVGILYFALVASLRRGDREEIREEVQILAALLRENPDDFGKLQWEIQGEWRAARPTRSHKRVLDEQGRTILESPEMERDLPPSIFPTPSAEGAEPALPDRPHQSAGRPWLLVAARAPLGASSRSRILQVGMDLSREEALLSRYRRRLWVVLGIALVPCILVGRWIARRGIRHVERITETARRIRSTTLDERIGQESLPSELAALAGTFNEMLDRLEESFQRLSRFSADIAHELRTPIQNLRGEAEVALGRPRPAEEYREILVSSLEECEGLSRLIDSLLFIARAESPETQIARESVDVVKELEAVRAFYDAAAAAAGVRLTAGCEGPLRARLDRTLFQRAVANLVGNAIAATPRGGTVHVDGRLEAAGVRIDVIDSGGGIPPELLPRLFDRFYRVDGSRSKSSGGSGLGLAIVKCIAELHGGSVAIASEPGRGTHVSLHLAEGEASPSMPADVPTTPSRPHEEASAG